MRSPLRVLLLALGLCISLTLVAQQTKTKTKTEAGKAKTKTETNKAKTDANKVKADSNKVTMDTMAAKTTTPTSMEGTGGGTGNRPAPYTATYSSQFTIGNPEHANMILAMWKDWDDNMLDRNAAWVADTITTESSMGTVTKGKDSFMLESRTYRNNYTTVKSTVEAIMPLHSTDRNENWVAIWGIEENTAKDGTVTRNRLHEIWRINRDGKIDYMRQFTAKLPTQ